MRSSSILMLVSMSFCVFCVFCVSTSEASLITIEITAEVTEVRDVDNLLEGGISVGNIITGTYTYESSTPISDPSIYWPAIYEQSVQGCGFSLSGGDFEFRTDPDNIDFRISITDNALTVRGYDRYAVVGVNNLPLSNGVPVYLINLSLSDYSETALSNKTLPVVAPNLEDWDYSNLFVEGPQESYFYIKSNVTSITPEPATLLLLGIGIPILSGLRRKHRKIKQ